MTACRRLGPGTYSLTMYGLGAFRSTASTRAVQKEATRRAAVASLPNLERRPGSAAASACSTLTATRSPPESYAS